MKIILVGYMGSGKSTVGQLLSEKIAIPFYDLDVLIEEKENKRIPEIFKEKGEIYFRKIEHKVLNEFIANNNDFVLALGGGTPCYANNHSVLQEKGVNSIYLNTSVDELTNRLLQQRNNRPLLSNLSNEELNDYIRKHLFDRSYYYNQCKFKLKTDGKSEKEIVEELVKLL